MLENGAETLFITNVPLNLSRGFIPAEGPRLSLLDRFGDNPARLVVGP